MYSHRCTGLLAMVDHMFDTGVDTTGQLIYIAYPRVFYGYCASRCSLQQMWADIALAHNII